MNSTRMPALALLAPLAAAFAFGLACSSGVRGAADQDLTAAKARSSKGAEIFERDCASCHGKRGEGSKSAPPLMGSGALPVKRVQRIDSAALNDPILRERLQRETVPGTTGEKEARARFNSAKDIYDYFTTDHRDIGGASLTPEEVLATLTFVLTAHGLAVPETGLTEENATSVANSK
jgi:mono/diheme cytochrome c family protein